MKKSITVLLALILVLSLGACGAPKEGGEASGLDISGGIKIGFIFPMTGPYGAAGEDARKGFGYAVDYINENGGVKAFDGAQVVPIFSDSQSDEEIAASEAERLILNEGVVAIVGCYWTASTVAVQQVCEKYGCPFMICCTTATTLVEEGHDWSFLVHETDPVTSECQVSYVQKMIEDGFDIKTVGFIYDNEEIGQNLAAIWREEYTKMGLEIVLDETVATDTTDMTATVSKFQQADPDLIMAFLSFNTVVLFTETAHGRGYSPNLMMCASCGEQDSNFIPTVGDKADGFMTAMGWGINILKNWPDKMWIAEEYAERNNGESFTGESAAGWSDMWLLYEALETCGEYDRTALRDAIADLHITTDQWWNIYPYEIEWDAGGKNIHAITPVGQFQNGGEVIIFWPDNCLTEGTNLVLPGSDLSTIGQ